MTRHGFRCTLARLGFDLDHDTDEGIWRPWIFQKLYEAEKHIGLQKAVTRVRSAIRLYDLTKGGEYEPTAKKHLATSIEAVSKSLAQKSCTTFATTSKEPAVKTIKVNVVPQVLTKEQKQQVKDTIKGLRALLNKNIPYTAYSASWALYDAYSKVGGVYHAVRDVAEDEGKKTAETMDGQVV